MTNAAQSPTTPLGADSDSQETREWMDALSAVIEAEGPERAHFLLEQLLEHARQKSIDMPFSATTGYVNTIETEQQEHAPGNLEIEERLRAYMRWNAMAILVQALTTFGTPRAKTTVATASTFRAMCRPASMPALISKAA